jgi:hypothetical protein
MAKEFLRSIERYITGDNARQEPQRASAPQPMAPERSVERRKRLTNEFSERVFLTAGMFDDSVRLEDLYRWKWRNNPNYDYNPPLEWVSFMERLNADERTVLGNAVGDAYRAGIDTLGQIREASVKELRKQKVDRNGIGQETAKFLKDALRRENSGKDGMGMD